jgi:hypothetical protein
MTEIYEGTPCKNCGTVYRYKKNNGCVECIKLKYQNSRESLWGRARIMVGHAKRRAKKAGIECSITHADILKKLQECNGFCPVTGDPFDLTVLTPNKQNAYGPSIDQIEAGKGYTPENTQIVCWWYNAAKGDWFTDSEARAKFGRLRQQEKNELNLFPKNTFVTRKNTEYIGVDKVKEGEFVVTVDDKRIGRYETPEIAAKVYDKISSAKMKSEGRRRQLNFPNDTIIDTIPESITPSWKNPNRGIKCGPSKFKGVTWITEKGLWKAQIRVNGKKKHLGYFREEEEAARAYNNYITSSN